MKILFQAPLLDPTWRGYVSNLLLRQINKTLSLLGLSVSAVHIHGECELLHSLGQSSEALLQKSILQVDSSLGTRLSEFDLQILLATWQQAWGLTLPNAINLIVGLEEPSSETKLIANCYDKLAISDLWLQHKHCELPIESIIHKLELNSPYRFIYPESLTKLTKQDVDKWIKDRNEKLVIYYPEPYSNPFALKQILDSLNLGDVDISIISNPLTIEELDYLCINAKSQLIGLVEDKESTKSIQNILMEVL